MEENKENQESCSTNPAPQSNQPNKTPLNDHQCLVYIFDTINEADANLVKHIITGNLDLINRLILKLRSVSKLPLYVGQRKAQDIKSVVQVLTPNDNTQYEAVYTHGFGNCLYNAISISLFGDESYSFKLRIAALAIIFKYESFFSIYSTLFQKPFGFFINQVAKDKACKQ